MTLVGEGQATVGFKFVASQAPKICEGCSLLKVCMGKLVPGRAYEVVEIKDKEHYCQLYEGNVRVAKVTQAPIEIIIKPQHAMEGATITFTGIECNMRCPYERACKPEGVKKGEKIRIETVLGDVSETAACHKKFRRVTALVVDSVR